MSLRRILLFLIILLLLSLLLSLTMYGVMIVNGFSNQPIWAMISYPLVSAILVLLIFRHRFVSTITTGFRFGLIDLKNVLLFFSIPILTSILFQPLADSLRYN